MLHVYICLLLSIFLPSSAFDSCPPAIHEVTSLPGYGPPPSKFVSGFIDAKLLPGMEEFGHMCFHYTYIASLGNPDADPVIIWYNGGPGVPGSFGLFLEFGPLLLNADSLTGTYDTTGIPTPVLNPFSWSRYANLLVMDNTPPIGHSYCSAVGPAANESQCGDWTDTSTIAANHKALGIFFNSVMPELRSNPVFVVGESYGGVFAPGIVGLLIDDPQGINLKGLIAIHGCMGGDVLCMFGGMKKDQPSNDYPGVYAGPWYDVLFFHGHGQISNELHARIMETCSMKELKGEIRPLSVPCQAIIDEMFAVIGGYWTYNLFDVCDWDWLDDPDSAMSSVVKDPYHPNGYPCSSVASTLWYTKEEVRRSLGVPLSSRYMDVDGWLSYTQDVADVRPMWVKALKAGLRVVEIAGDMDSNVNIFALQDLHVDMWKNAGYTQTQPWRPWTLDGLKSMGGYSIEWAGGNASFVTFRGAGHMVPEYKAEASSIMLEHWLAGKELPRYEPKRIRRNAPKQPTVVIM